MSDASNTGLPEGKQSRMPDSTKAGEQYSELYAPTARWRLKPFCVGEIFLFSTCSSGVSKLVGSNFYSLTIDLLTPVISNCCIEAIKLVSLFLAITIAI